MMKIKEILDLKTQLTQRLNALQIELNLSEENPNPEILELTTFRNTSGFGQFFYYLFNKDRIRAAAEYEALLQLQAQPIDLRAEDSDLLEAFGDGTPDTSMQVSSQKSAKFEDLKQTLYRALTSTSLMGMEKNKAIDNFWASLSNMLTDSPQATDRVLAAYIFERNDCGLKHKPIMLSTLEDSGRPPSFLMSLPSSGNQHDYSDVVRAHGVSQDSAPILSHNNATNFIHSTPLVAIQTHTRIFGFIPYSFMDDIEAHVQARKTTLDNARQFIHSARDASKDYMRPFVDGLKSIFESWKKSVVRVEKSQAIPAAPLNQDSQPFSVSKLFTTAASFIPGVNATTTTGIPVASAPAIESEKSWYSPFLPW